MLKSSTLTICVVLSLFCFEKVIGQNIQINEVVSSNTTFLDEDSDSPDWIELYNPTQEDISITEWSITDREDNPKWLFGETILPADGYLLIWASGKDRANSYPRTLVDLGDEWKYLTPSQPLSHTWTSIDFNDSNWSTGPSGFGYSDGDDATILSSSTRSIFVRKEINIDDISKVESLILDIDYDDGFVAYLNGEEVARDNMSQDNPNFNDFSITDHEAIMYQGGRPDRFNIEKSMLVNGKNVLAVSGHNISTTSSDLTLIPMLTAEFNEPTTVGIDPPTYLNFENAGVHTNFKISASETIYLYDKEGNEVSSLFAGNAPADVSYGIRPSDQQFIYYEEPTPGSKNSESGFEGVLMGDIVFSHDGGQYSDDFQLTLSSPDEGGIILYTTDATIPTSSSNVYSTPISINKNTVVRAKLFSSGYIPSKTETKAYILDKSHEIPVISLVTEPDNFFSDEKGIYVLGNGFFPNFPYEGSNIWEDWERPVHVSLFEKDGTSLQFDAGTKIFGGWSRALDQRSLSVFARGEYGTSEIDYPLFPDQPYEKYQAFVLRNSGNDFLNSNIRDITLTSLMEGTGMEFQSYRSVATYINGEYWGFFNMREKMNEHFLASRHNIDPVKIDILGPFDELIQGSDTDFKNMLAFLETNSLVSEENYQFIADQVDIDNFIMHHVAQIYFDNKDWPGNNNKQWRPHGGKWRWMLFDTDFGFGIWDNNAYEVNTLDFALEANGPFWPNPPSSTLLFRRLVANIDFRNKFINQFADELNSRFLPEKVEQHIENSALNIASEVLDHYNRWGGSIDQHYTKVEQMIRFGNLRPSRIKNHIKSQFNIPAHHQITLQVNNPIQGYIQVNSLKLLEPFWKGDYFENVPITITAFPKPGYEFSHWAGSGSSTDQTLKVDMHSDLAFTAIFVPSDDEQAVIINEINYKSSDEYDTGDWIELHNPNNTPIDLSNWVITDEEKENGFSIPENTILQGNDYLILAGSQSKLEAIHDDVNYTIDDLSFGLSSEGETVRLYDPEGILRDSVTYGVTDPWPELANGQGYTLELKSPNLDNSLPENWATIHNLGSPGKTNQEVTHSEDENLSINIKRYPNPFENKVQIDISVIKAGSFSAKLYNRNGELMETMHDQQISAGKHTISSDLGHLASGLYILEVKTDEKKESFHWVKI